MEGCLSEYNPEESEVNMTEHRIPSKLPAGKQNTDFSKKKNSPGSGFRVPGSEKGIALVMALIISLGIMVLVTGALYFTIQSTSISGAGKRYSTAEEAGDGAVEIIKEGINSVQRTDPLPAIINDPSGCFLSATIINGNNCTTNITLPGNIGNYYTATTTFQNLFRVALPGSRLEFGRAAGATSVAIYYRIIVSVTDSTNTINAENSVLYRFTN